MQAIKSAQDTAKQTLKGKWHLVICVFCMVAAAFSVKMLLTSLISMIFSQGMSSFAAKTLTYTGTIVTVFLELFAFSPLYIGAARWLWQVTAGADEPLSTVFYYYETLQDYKKAVEISFGLLWRCCVYSVICIIPFVLFGMAKQLVAGSLYFGLAVKIGVYFGWVFSGIMGVVLLVTLISRHYLLLPTIFADDGLDTYSAFRISSIISKGKVAPIMYMVLRFLPLAALCFLAVPIIWVVPYFAASVTAYARGVIEGVVSASPSAENQQKIN